MTQPTQMASLTAAHLSAQHGQDKQRQKPLKEGLVPRQGVAMLVAVPPSYVVTCHPALACNRTNRKNGSRLDHSCAALGERTPLLPVQAASLYSVLQQLDSSCDAMAEFSSRAELSGCCAQATGWPPAVPANARGPCQHDSLG